MTSILNLQDKLYEDESAQDSPMSTYSNDLISDKVNILHNALLYPETLQNPDRREVLTTEYLLCVGELEQRGVDVKMMRGWYDNYEEWTK